MVMYKTKEVDGFNQLGLELHQLLTLQEEIHNNQSYLMQQLEQVITYFHKGLRQQEEFLFLAA